ncbi:phosphatase PAP2 family protein [Polaribacter sp. IC073]|uniref:phosphatase PAP2 family protein n=1 Tax=Polaribacter sp. IC073 TaxID=2508540 RepID=UPI0011BFBDF4|nr:phosphatase PAP2 family protein [Polaribacter sp. IC073]TXD47656.1 phosphatase PAP2 family protein [Polaribacter sp. IC073]
MKKEVKIIINRGRMLISRLSSKYDKQLPYIIISALALIVVIAGIKLFVELTDNLKTDILFQLDITIAHYIVSHRSPLLTQYFVLVTNIGDVYGYLIVFAVCASVFYFIFKSLKYVVQLLLVIVLAFSSNLILKQIINRSRPDLEHLVTVETLSYPSGHAMASMAFYGFLIYLFYQFKIGRLLKFGVILLLLVFILSIGVSRIYLGVHYPSDIAGGFIAGFIWVVFCILILNILKIFKEDPKT